MDILNNVKDDKIIGKLLLIFFIISKYQDSEDSDTHDVKTTVTAASIRLGREVVRVYFNELFNNQTKIKSLSAFIDDLKEKDIKFIYLLEDIHLAFIGGKLMDILINSDVVETHIVKQYNKRNNYFRLTSTFL